LKKHAVSDVSGLIYRRGQTGDFFRGLDPVDRCSDNCFPMRYFAEIWGNASDNHSNNFLFWWRKIRAGVFELEDSPQN
jgi:hypothetical protein